VVTVTGTDPLAGASPARAAALTVRFALELALLTGAAVLAWHAAAGWQRCAAVVLAPAAVAILWGLLLSPKAAIPLPKTVMLIIEAALFAGIAAGLLTVGSGIPAAVGLAVWLIDRAALARLHT
jgi:hypothetical protein